MNTAIAQLLSYAGKLIAVVFVITLHEFAHAFVAYRCGDPTAKWNGRMTLNPMRHFDVAGLICFLLVGFGWAKPVPVNPNNYKHYRRDSVFVSVAGVVTNYITAFLFYPLCLLVINFVRIDYLSSFLYGLTYFGFACSLGFCVFNLLPFFPLDGFNLIDALSRRQGKVVRFLRKYGQMILLALIAESFICNLFVNRLGVSQMAYFDILGYVMQFATGIFGWPITAFWSWIFSFIFGGAV